MSFQATRFAIQSITPLQGDTDNLEDGCLTIGTGFSIKDLENDGNDGVNCAGKYNGGWWYKKTANSECGTCFLNSDTPRWGDVTEFNTPVSVMYLEK